ncbi:MAG: glucose-1-phosphate thymidylyltransferase [Cyclobacteriaceae bacterium]|nr:glucose-1-phosphate thymidylyltransferase [Cyclobacteriaceae bacterium]
MNPIVFDDPSIRTNLLPFTFTRPVGAIRIGILTIIEKWEKHLGTSASYLTQDYLSEKFLFSSASENLFINGAVCPDEELTKSINDLKIGEALTKDGTILACVSGNKDWNNPTSKKEYSGTVTLIDQVWKIFQYNGAQIRSDFNLITKGRKSAGISDPHTRTYSPENIFVEEGAVIQAATLNASTGPIYIGKNVQIQEGSLIRGPFSVGDESVVNMGAKMRSDTTVGPYCKVGGEISNAVIFGYSSKVHDGFLGSSVLGEWCNMGADTNTSNLKNNYDNVKLWNYGKQGFANTGLTFCGLMMGDHTKCGINSMFNTGTVAGVASNIFGDGYPRNFIPSFAWGGAAGFMTYQLNKVYETAAKAMERRNITLSEVDKKILKNVFDQCAGERVWEKKS